MKFKVIFKGIINRVHIGCKMMTKTRTITYRETQGTIGKGEKRGQCSQLVDGTKGMGDDKGDEAGDGFDSGPPPAPPSAGIGSIDESTPAYKPFFRPLSR